MNGRKMTLIRVSQIIVKNKRLVASADTLPVWFLTLQIVLHVLSCSFQAVLCNDCSPMCPIPRPNPMSDPEGFLCSSGLYYVWSLWDSPLWTSQFCLLDFLLHPCSLLFQLTLTWMSIFFTFLNWFSLKGPHLTSSDIIFHLILSPWL